MKSKIEHFPNNQNLFKSVPLCKAACFPSNHSDLASNSSQPITGQSTRGHLRGSWARLHGAGGRAGPTSGTGTWLPAVAVCHAPALSDWPGSAQRDGHS